MTKQVSEQPGWRGTPSLKKKKSIPSFILVLFQTLVIFGGFISHLWLAATSLNSRDLNLGFETLPCPSLTSYSTLAGALAYLGETVFVWTERIPLFFSCGDQRGNPQKVCSLGLVGSSSVAVSGMVIISITIQGQASQVRWEIGCGLGSAHSPSILAT